MPGALRDELYEWLRIPSISTGTPDREGLQAAADWAAARVRAAGGSAELKSIDGRNPLVLGELPAATPGAPTVVIYGHYDVQSPGDLGLWQSPPFEPTERDGRIYARGACDDKGNFLPLLHVACELAAAGSLPVNVRVFVEGEEENGSEAACAWVAGEAGDADAAIVFDSGMADAQTPAITIGLRGIVQGDITVTAGRRDLHSGMYGGTVHNALSVLTRALNAVLPDAHGRVRDELQVGVEPPSPAELESWARLPSGDTAIAQAGGIPVSADAGATFYERTGALPSLDVNAIHGGEPRTVIPHQVHSTITQRLAPRQDPATIAAAIEALMRAQIPDGVELTVNWEKDAEPALFPAEHPVLQLAAGALERACGTAPVFLRSGGSIPVVAEMGKRGWPTIVSGFALDDDEIHAPNESYRLESLRLGEVASRELLTALASI